MKKILLFICFFAPFNSGFAQDSDLKKWLKEVNNDVWLPFIEAWATNDAEKYNGLHTKNLIRAGDSDIQGYESYATRNMASFAKRKERKMKVTINFRLLERTNNGELGSERGIYETTYVTEDGIIEKSYGKFHVFLRKVEGVWKIAIDYDSDENKTINEDSFKVASAIDDFSKY